MAGEAGVGGVPTAHNTTTMSCIMLRYYLARLKECWHKKHDFLLEMKHQPVQKL